MNEILEHEGVQRVRAALQASGAGSDVIVLDDTARTAEDAAKALGVELGAIVKSLVFLVGNRFALALIAGDHRCVEAKLAPVLFIQGDVRKAEAGEVKFATGFTIGGVAPIGLTRKLPVVIDRSLKRFETVYAAAGHPHAVFPTTVEELKRLTGGIVSYAIAELQ